MRSLVQIKQEIVTDILELRSDIRLVEGDSQYDVIVQATANQFYRYEQLLEFENRTRNLTAFTTLISDETFKQSFATTLGENQDGTAISVTDVDTLISTRLDDYVQAWAVTRNEGSYASGIVTVYLTSNAAVTWDTATTFTSKQGLEYVVTSALTVVPNSNTTLGLFYVDIAVQASVTGSDSNAIAGAINSVAPSFANFSYCTNATVIDGGTDGETDLDLITRSSRIWAERVNGSKQAYEGIAEEQSYVDDALTMDEDDSNEEIYLGSVCDTFVQFSSEDTELVEETFYWPGADSNAGTEQFSFTPSNQPVLSTLPPVVFMYTTGGTEEQVIFEVGTDYTLEIVTDTNTYGGSVKANNLFKIKMILNTDNYQRRLKVIYSYDKNPFKLQQVFDNSDYKIVGPSALVKKASTTPVRIIVEPTFAFGYDEQSVQDAITSNCLIYFNGGTTSFGRQYARKQIGQDIVHTDISDIILRTEGVVSYDRDTFFIINTTNGDLTDPVIVLNSQYATLHDVLFEFSTYNLSNFTASAVVVV